MAEAGPWRIIGLMSGTSMDGVDAALIETDGERVLSFGPALTLRYQPEQRAVLRAAIAAAMGEFDAQMKTRGAGENKRWEVAELKLLTPSGCEALDAQVTAYMRDAIPKFAEPWKDLDKNGWTRIPAVQVKLD